MGTNLVESGAGIIPGVLPSRDSLVGSKRNLNALTGLRFLAAINVVFYHFVRPALPRWTYPLSNIVGAGYVSVSLFFLLSGFILSFSYLETNGKMRGTSWNFYVSRFARIYPAYLIAFSLAAPSNILTSLHVNHLGVALGKLLTGAFLVLTLQQSWTPWTAWYWNFPAWSISVEAFFYLVFPWIGPRLTRLRPAWWISTACGLLLLSLCAPMALYLFWGATLAPGLSDHLQMAVEFNPLLRLPEFLIGILLGRAYNLGLLPQLSSSIFSNLSATSILAILTFCPFIPHPLLANGLLIPLFAILIYSLAAGKGLLAYGLSRPTMILLGEASYGLYILQIPMALVLRVPPPHNALRTFAIYFVVLISTAILSWRFVESPLRICIRRWFSIGENMNRHLPVAKDSSWLDPARLNPLKEIE
jgi:peptidoglycan/LPS O-acetylase OafA/YrhL